MCRIRSGYHDQYLLPSRLRRYRERAEGQVSTSGSHRSYLRNASKHHCRQQQATYYTVHDVTTVDEGRTELEDNGPAPLPYRHGDPMSDRAELATVRKSLGINCRQSCFTDPKTVGSLECRLRFDTEKACPKRIACACQVRWAQVAHLSKNKKGSREAGVADQHRCPTRLHQQRKRKCNSNQLSIS